MERYGWTLTEVKEQPYFQLLDILNHEAENENNKQSDENEVITGAGLAAIFSG
ncbi:hypothetical protein [Staphylococcus xylosus]|uniref:hypothetical protein n=1 Tax=Staphylococcus xylosus TaxID=1288 RepID=UPI0018EC028B|nr:hypothetical protein [Staphylococcus xylosus]